MHLDIHKKSMYQLQQEAPRPKRIICPREVSSTCFSFCSIE
uniref:Uncharacterized protein n=1 Tax=Varanus komodoensis TaxID=61221 RepID=A0A8D2LAM1_VARKO